VNKQTCSGHGKSGDCIVCRFGRCQWCGACFSREKVFWNGCCDKCKAFELDAETAESHTRVRETAEAQLGPVSGGRVKRKAVRRSEEEVAAEPQAEEVVVKRAPSPKVAKKPTQPPPAAAPKKRNTASSQPLSQGAVGMRVVAQTSQLVNHANGTATLTTITELAPM
jgi:predicted  nucleic acid-binding Zn-ribbon protein